jgi:hypothetical protein
MVPVANTPAGFNWRVSVLAGKLIENPVKGT